MWQSEVIRPATERGLRPDEVLGVDFGDRMSVLSERALLGMYHLQQTQTWTTNLIEAVEMQLAAAGLHSRLAHPPAMCFLDITGYTRLTQEHGDAAAAELAEDLGRIVQRSSVKHGGRAVKWLGDGVMLHFPQPGLGVEAALEMVAGVVEAGLPPAHVGLHAGPVIFQEGDYYGSTVNVAARIADYARPGEVVVSQDVVDASADAPLTFREIGPSSSRACPASCACTRRPGPAERPRPGRQGRQVARAGHLDAESRSVPPGLPYVPMAVTGAEGIDHDSKRPRQILGRFADAPKHPCRDPRGRRSRTCADLLP